jgi:hypothetical protein
MRVGHSTCFRFVLLAGLVATAAACTGGDKVALEEYAPQSPDADIEAVSLSASDDDTFDPERVGTEFPDTAKQVAVWYRWDGADSGKKVGIRWSKDGEVVLEQGDTLAKVSGASAYVLKMAEGSKLPIGDYQVELLEDGVAVTKIPFKVGSGAEPAEPATTAAVDDAATVEDDAATAEEDASTAEEDAVAAEETQAPDAEEPAPAEQPVSAEAVPVEAALSSRGFPAPQATKWPGVTVQVTELARKGKNLNAKLRFTNNGTEKARPSFYYTSTYAIDAENQKYEVLKDEKGTYLGSLGTGYHNWWGEDIGPGASQLVWMRFPAPPPGVKMVTIQVDGLDPIEDVGIQN